MKNNRILTVLAAIVVCAGCQSTQTQEKKAADSVEKNQITITPRPFQPAWDSLQQYKCPDWFRDAKFGIWAHWGPQAVPMDGDWYARGMYEQGSGHYKHHLANYGHPSTNGYKDIIPLWKAEKWDPDRLMALYKKAGARYFVSMGCHHDNFDLWSSRFHKWNAVNMGPKRDVVGDWQKAAKKYGLRFGVSEHMGASFTWFQVSHRADKTGPLAGVPYDGADPKYADLYHQPADPNDKGWYSNNPEWHQEWYKRITDLIDNYQLDLLYTDGAVPFGNEVGRSMIAHLYNTDLKNHGGRLDVVYTCKQKSDGMWVQDLERGVMPGINPDPWQTDTSIADWYYNKNWKYRKADWVIRTLVDIVSKNGNLLLNVVQRPDGSLDPEVEQLLEEIAAWMKVNSEAIYKTRPWLTYGEGPTKAKGGNFKEDFAFTYKDIRFTTKGKTLYAVALGWPADGRLVIRSLAKPTGETINKVAAVTLLGHNGKLQWSQTAEGLVVTLPAQKPCEHAFVLKISGADFKPVEFTQPTSVIRPSADGSLTLDADSVELHGSQVRVEEIAGQPNVGFWDNPKDWLSWKVNFTQTGTFQVSASCATPHSDSEIIIELAGQQLVTKVPMTNSFQDFKSFSIGTIEVKQSGEQIVKVQPRDAKTWKAINLRFVKFSKSG
jgi:alpha-L-fucosidase